MKKYIYLAATALMLAACTNDNEPTTPDNGPVAAQVNASIYGTLTRASGTQWADLDCIGITSAGGGTDYINVPYSYNKSEAKFQPDKWAGIYFQSPEAVTFNAYYPFTGTQGTAAGTIDVSTAADYQTATYQADIDFLFAKGATGSKTSPTVDFTGDAAFHHSMSQITLTFKAGADVDFEEETLSSYTLKGRYLQGTFDTATGEAKADESKSAATLTIPLTDVTATTEGNVVSSVILLPQNVASGKIGLEVAVGGQTYHADLLLPNGKTALAPGCNYIWPVTVNKTSMTVGTAEIKEWEEVKGNDTTAEM